VLAEGSFDDIMAHAEVRAAYLGKQGETHAPGA
jgi:branched-chain amino acid transport system ATP-binding protein